MGGLSAADFVKQEQKKYVTGAGVLIAVTVKYWTKQTETQGKVSVSVRAE